MTKFYRCLMALMLSMPLAASLWAQSSGGRLQGSLRDSTQAVLPGATVTATNTETGIARTATTDAQGRFVFNLLPPAKYDLSGSAAGFKTSLKQGIQLTVGAELSVDLTLEVGAVAEQVTVTGEAPLVETQTGSVSGVIEERTIREIPLNGRSFANLMELQPGAIITRAGGRSTTAGTGEKISLGGARPTQMSFLLDGADMMGKDNTNPAGASGVLLGVDSVQEFRVFTSGFSAEFGRNAGGVVTAVTKSGSNQFHGTAFEFLRNDNLDSYRWEDKAFALAPKTPVKPEFKRNQFGGTLGGPVIHDKTFFFASYEGLRDRLGVTNIQNVPTAEIRSTAVASIRPYVNLYPLPNAGSTPTPGVGLYSWNGSSVTDQNDFLVRVDHQLTSADSLMFRVFYDDSSSETPTNLNLTSSIADSRIQSYVLDHKRIFGASLVNDFRFTFNRQKLSADNGIAEGLSSLEFIQGRGFGLLNTQQIQPISTGGTEPRFWTQNMFEYIDDAVVSHGNHTFKLGGIAKRIRYNGFSAARFRGEYQFATLQTFLQGVPSRYEAAFVFAGVRGLRQWLYGLYFQDDWRVASNLTLNLGVRYEMTTVPTEAAGRLANLRNQTDSAVVLGDPLWINPSLKNFAPRIGFAYDPTGDGKTSIRGGWGMYFDQLLPLYYRDSPFRILPFQQRIFVTPETLSTALNVPTGTTTIPFPNAHTFYTPQPRLSDPAVQIDLMNYRPHQPYTMQYNLTLQRQLISGWSLMLGYLGSQSRNNSRNVNWNSALPTAFINGQKCWSVPETRNAAGAITRLASPCSNGTAAPIRNRNFSTILQREFDANANYNSFQMQAKRRFANGYDLNIIYQFSRTMDVQSGIGGSTDFGNITSFSMDPDDWRRDYSRAAFDIRHYLTINGSYELPGQHLTGIAGKALGGWRLSGLVSRSSGEPLNISNTIDIAGNNVRIFGTQERPNLRAGASNDPTEGTSAGCTRGNVTFAAGQKLKTPDLWFDPCAFERQANGTYGNLGRNTLTGPGFFKVDLAVLKDIAFTESRKLEFRWELFNMFNNVNFDVPVFNIFNSQNEGAYADGNAGKIRSTRGTARQMQFALKYIF